MSASVCVVLLAASAAAPSLAGAREKNTLDERQAAQLVRALGLLEQGQPARAIAIYDRLINTRTLPPELLARALLNRGLAHQRLKHHDAAIRDYDAALRIEALSVRARVTALYNRALAFRARGEAGRAMEDLTAALHLDPAFAPAYFARGNILHERGLYYLALADYDQALASGHRQKYRVHYARALLFSALNSLPRTKEALYAALKEKPDFAPARRRLAAILQGRLPRTRLFADLLKKRPVKRITARIVPAAGSGAAYSNVRTASVMIVGAPVLNVRKAPQRAAVAPPAVPHTDPARDNDGDAAPRRSWRVASTAPLPPAPAAASAQEKAGNDTARKDTAATASSAATQAPDATQASAAPARPPVPQPRRRPPVLHTASVDAAPAASAQQPSWQGWAVQLASQRSEQAARAHWQRLQGRVRRLTGRDEVAVQRAEIAGRGIFWRLRLVGFDDRHAASRACRSLKRNGISCLVVRAGS